MTEPNDPQKERPHLHHDPSEEEQEVLSREEREKLNHFRGYLFKNTPTTYITSAIVGINSVIFIAMILSGVDIMSPTSKELLMWGANSGEHTLGGEWWRLLSSMFLHIGVVHLAINMWVLWDIGQLVEKIFGNVGFFLLYMLSGLGGSLTSAGWNPATLSAGASGAVFGVFGALMGFILSQKDSIPPTVFKKLKSSGISFLVLNLIIGFSIEAIDMAAHTGGFLAGLGCGYFMSLPLKKVTAELRSQKNIAMLIVGSLLLAGTAYAIPKESAALQRLLRSFATVEKYTVDEFNQGRRLIQLKKMSHDKFIKVLEADILPRWRGIQQKFLGFKQIPRSKKKYFAALKQYIDYREMSWSYMLAYLKTGSLEKLALSRKNQEAVSRTIKQLNKMNKR